MSPSSGSTTPARTASRLITQRIPILRWAPAYRAAYLRGDLVAGGTVAVMVIPQGMAYAVLAGMPPITGLYVAVLPLLAYAVFGSSPYLAVGSVATVSLLVAAGLEGLAGDVETYVALAALLALLVGVIQLAMGVLRLGAVVNFLPQPVASGFISAAAIIIGLSQAGDFLGIDVPTSSNVIDAARHLAAAVTTVNVPTLAVGSISLVAMLLGKRFSPRLPVPLLAVVAATVAVSALNLQERGVAILGRVPAGLPGLSMPTVELDAVRALLPVAATIAFLSYMESVSIAQGLAAKTRTRFDANQHLYGSGAMNLSAGVFSGFPVGGSFTRSAINFQSGAQTPLAGLITAGIVAASLVVLTPLFTFMPRAVLAAIVLLAVIGLVDAREAVAAFRTRRADGVALAVTFLATLVIGVRFGILVGVAFSLVIFLHRSTRPAIAELGRVEGTVVFRNIERYPARTGKHVAALRLDGPLYFTNARALEERVSQIVTERNDLRYVVLDASTVTDLDATGAQAISRLDDQLAGTGIELHLATVRGPVRDVLERLPNGQRLLRERSHTNVMATVQALDLPPDSPLLGPDLSEEPPEQVL